MEEDVLKSIVGVPILNWMPVVVIVLVDTQRWLAYVCKVCH